MDIAELRLVVDLIAKLGADAQTGFIAWVIAKLAGDIIVSGMAWGGLIFVFIKLATIVRELVIDKQRREQVSPAQAVVDASRNFWFSAYKNDPQRRAGPEWRLHKQLREDLKEAGYDVD